MPVLYPAHSPTCTLSHLHTFVLAHFHTFALPHFFGIIQNMKTRLFPFLLLLALALSGGTTRRVRAEAEGQTPPPQTPGITLTVRAGLDGQCRQNAWMPVWVTVQNDSVPLETALIRIAVGEDTYQISTDLPPRSRKAFETYVHAPWNPRFTTQLVSEGKILAQASTAITCGNPEDLYVGLWSADVDTASTIPPSVSAGKGLHRAFLSEAAMPAQAIGLEGLDVLVIGADSDTRALSEAQREAIRLWVLSGGQTVVFGGGNWTYALGLEDMLPFRPQGSRSVTPPGMDAPLTLATGAVQTNARILQGDSETPLLLTRPLGYGWVTYTTFDPRAIPVERAWDILAPVWSAQGQALPTAPLSPGDNGDGYNALHILPSQSNAVLPLLCLVSSAYLLAVGPLNFYIFRRRREWIWGSSLAIAGVFTLGILTAGGFLHGKPLVNQLVVVLSWPESTTARVEGLLGIYSPRRGTYTYQADGDLWAFPLEAYTGTTNHYPRPVVEHAGGLMRFPDIHMDANSMTHAGISSARDAPRYTGSITLNIPTSQQDVQLSGSLTWEEDFPLLDAVLVWGDLWVSLGDIQPGSKTPLHISEATAEERDDFIPAIMEGRRYYTYSSGSSEKKQRYAMLSALLSDGASPEGSRAVIAGWSDAAHGLPLAWEQNGHPIKTVGQTLYLLSLPLRQEETSAHTFTYRYTLPQYLYSRYIYDETKALEGSIPFDIFAGMTPTALRLFVRSLPATSLPQVSMWNFRTRRYDPLLRQDNALVPQGDPQDYFSIWGGYLLNIDNTAPQAGSLDIRSIEMELEFTPSP